MENKIRKWNCDKCGRSNEIVPALGERLKCEFCGHRSGLGFEDALVADVCRLNREAAALAAAAKLTAVGRAAAR